MNVRHRPCSLSAEAPSCTDSAYNPQNRIPSPTLHNFSYRDGTRRPCGVIFTWLTPDPTKTTCAPSTMPPCSEEADGGNYLESYRARTNLALLAPDVRAAFPTDDSVNEALRSLVHGYNLSASRKCSRQPRPAT
jgi:hypothetical protein